MVNISIRKLVMIYAIIRLSLSLILLFIVLLPFSAEAEIKVIDADTIELVGKKIRLSGIDAPELAQKCESAQNQYYKCGIKASTALKELLSSRDTNFLSCEFSGKDLYGRLLGECALGKLNINSWLVQNGWALAYRKYSSKFVPYENEAKSNKLGIWSGRFVEPWSWRKGNRLENESVKQNNGCTIKGNISSNGEKIYHVKTGQFYERTKIKLSKGERWFCTESEAKRSGWRKSRR